MSAVLHEGHFVFFGGFIHEFARYEAILLGVMSKLLASPAPFALAHEKVLPRPFRSDWSAPRRAQSAFFRFRRRSIDPPERRFH
jgi:hypothetical protein